MIKIFPNKLWLNEKNMNRLKLTTEFLCSPITDPDSFALTGGDIWCHGFTDGILVAFKLTCIKCTVVHVRSRVHVLVTFSERSWLVSDYTAVLLFSVLVPHGFGTCLARFALAERRAAWNSGHLPALPKLCFTSGCLAVKHCHVILTISIVVATQTT